MTCPGGCIGGGGQLLGVDEGAVRARMASLYAIDASEELRVAHKNTAVRQLYEDLLGEPLSPTSHHLLHTTYAPRNVVR